MLPRPTIEAFDLHLVALELRLEAVVIGGSALALVPAGQRSVSAAITAEFAGQGWRPPVFFQAVPSQGALRLR